MRAQKDQLHSLHPETPWLPQACRPGEDSYTTLESKGGGDDCEPDITPPVSSKWLVTKKEIGFWTKMDGLSNFCFC